MLDVLLGNKLHNVCVVVTRYFGGTLLGTGGLVRAYTDAAKACIANTDVVCKKKVIPLQITTNYTDLGKIQYILANDRIEIKDCVYGENVDLYVEVFVDGIDKLEKMLIEATAARVTLDRSDAIYSLCRREEI